MNIHEVSQITGVSEQMIRYYEKIGLIHPERNPNNNYRTFTNHDVYMTVVARSYSSIGIELSDIQSTIRNDSAADASQKLSVLCDRLREEEQQAHSRYLFAKELHDVFDAVSNGKNFLMVHYDTLYFYPNTYDDAYNEVIHSIRVTMAALRLKHQYLKAESYPNDIGILSTYCKADPVKPEAIYQNVDFARFLLHTPNSSLVSPCQIHEHLKILCQKKLHPSGDAFIYQIGLDPAEENDLVIVEYEVARQK